MLNLVLLTPNTTAANAIEQLTQEAGVFKIVLKGSPVPPLANVLRALRAHDVDLILVDVGDWGEVSLLVSQIQRSGAGAPMIGFRSAWDAAEKAVLEAAGITDLLHEPFSPAELETVAYDVLHREHAVTNRDILAFLPAKAGGGCSTAALNMAAAVANLKKKVLLVESDRRSGVFSIMLNLKNRYGLSEALQNAGELTLVEWNHYYVNAFGMHMLLADPAHRGPLPSWAGYYKLLRFLQGQYDFLFFDLPEVVNEATAEVVKSARAIFIVCTPEVPSLKMASQRNAELEACEVPAGNIHMILNRWERGGLSLQDVEKVLGRPVFGTLPNDYSGVRESILESRLVSSESPFAEGCRVLARKLSGLPGSTAGTVRPGTSQEAGTDHRLSPSLRVKRAHGSNPRSLNVDFTGLSIVPPRSQHGCVVLQRHQQAFVIGPPCLIQDVHGSFERFCGLRPSLLHPVDFREIGQNQPRLRMPGRKTLLQNGHRGQAEFLRFRILLAPEGQGRGAVQIQPDAGMAGRQALFVNLTSPIY